LFGGRPIIIVAISRGKHRELGERECVSKNTLALFLHGRR
jgi:hypothetical protein